MVVMRHNLRKVNITRSPGGTPLVSGKNCEHGTGLTPMMTRALRRKFQVTLMCIGLCNVMPDTCNKTINGTAVQVFNDSEEVQMVKYLFII